MSCRLLHEKLDAYLRGTLAAPEAASLERHLETCQACQEIDVVGAAFGAWVRRRMPPATLPPGFQQRLQDALAVSAVEPGRRGVLLRFFGSPWGPRMAMAAVLLVLVSVPIRGLFRAPALARVAVESHQAHTERDPALPLPTCCVRLPLAVGDPLDSGHRAVVPDLSEEGLELALATRCTLRGEPVTILAYRDVGEKAFSLYIADRLPEEFDSLRRADGLRPVKSAARGSAVTIWEQGGLVYFWIGPERDPQYATALSHLQH